MTCDRDQGNRTTLFNQDLNVRTYDFAFRDIDLNRTALPGADVATPPEPFSPAAVSAHANAEQVARFVRDVLRRNGLDNQGERYVSSVNCVSVFNGSSGQEWRNAAWIGTQMVYGQRRSDGRLRSYSIAVDVVGHEIMHGVTDRTSRLEYRRITGAMNESYSDIFGVIISNWPNLNFSQWNWEMGESLTGTGIPLRDLRDPARFNQPSHMDQYVELPLNQDNGGVHRYSGIHNKAFYNIATSRAAGNGPFVFTPTDLAAMFYIALSQHLSRTSLFTDSRRGVELAAASLFRTDPAKAAKLAAVGAGFAAVGIA
jgi:bacillolysin/neutral peptidase B